MTGPVDEETARRRFSIINGVRLGGVALLLAGIATLAGSLGLPDAAGYVLVVAGAVGTFLVPTMLARRWSSRRQR